MAGVFHKVVKMVKVGEGVGGLLGLMLFRLSQNLVNKAKKRD
jgi:type II secretory pathway component PulF